MAPEVWLRGPVPGYAATLQPAVHSLLQIREELERTLPTLTAAQLWETPGGAASIAYHVQHLAGSLDRLLTYARGEALDAAQMARLTREGERDQGATGESLLTQARDAIDGALRELRDWSAREGELGDPRAVGRNRLPSTVLGLLFHAAEHAQRHAGQIATTARVLGVR